MGQYDYQDDDDGQPMSMLDALRAIKGTGSMSAHAGVEEQMRAEAKGLMADEAGRNHNAPMPNTPRDPKKDKRMPDSFLQGKSASDFGQNAFASPLPDELQMSKMNGAMRLPPVMKADPMKPKDFAGMGQPDAAPKKDPMVVSVTPGSYYDTPGQTESNNPFMGDERFHPSSPSVASPSPVQDDPVSVSTGGHYGLDLPDVGHQDVQDLSPAGPAQDDPREMLKQYIMKQNQANPAEHGKDQRLAQMMQGNEQANSKLGLMALLLASANKAGSINGKTAGNEEANQYFGGLQAQNNRSGEMIAKDRATEKKSQDDKLKGLMYLSKMKQDDEKFQADNKHRADQLQEITGYHQGSLKNQADSNANNNWYKQQTMDNQVQEHKDMMDLRRNPPEKKMTPLDQANIDLLKKKATKEQYDIDHPEAKKSGMQDIRNKTMAGTYDEWVQQGLRSNVKTSIDTLNSIADQLEKDNWGSGTIVGNTPNALLGAVGNNSPKYEAAINGAIANSYKQKLGGSFTENEGNRLLKNTWDPRQSPKENASRIRRTAKEMQGKMQMQDDAVQYFEANDAKMDGYKGGTKAIQGSQTPKNAAGTWENAPSMRAEDL